VLFMQLNKARGALKHAALPEGLKDGADAAATQKDVPAVMGEPQEVTYDLGDFTTNAKDGKFVKMNIALAIKSFYLQDDWDDYQTQLDQYNKQRQDYFDFQKKQASGAKKAGLPGLAVPQGVRITQASFQPGQVGVQTIPVAEEGKKDVAPTLPDKSPDRPLTRLEQALKESDAKVRNIINTEINNHNATDLIGPDGKADFKKKVIDTLNGTFDSSLGSVEDVYFKELVTT